MIKKLIVFIFLINSLFAKENLWLTNSIEYKFNDRNKIFGTYEHRWDQLGFFEGYVDQYSIGFERKVISNFSLALSYKREITEDILHENRYVLGLKHKLSLFSFRLRIESRNFEEFYKMW